MNTPDYSDMLSLSRPPHGAHTPMSMENRAAQFAPFAALNGHEEAIAEMARLTVARPEMTPEEAEKLSKRLQLLAALPDPPKVRYRFFVPDAVKSGGHIEEHVGKIRRLLPDEGCIEFTDGFRAPLPLHNLQNEL